MRKPALTQAVKNAGSQGIDRGSAGSNLIGRILGEVWWGRRFRLPAILFAILTPALLAQPQGGLQAGVAKVNLEPALGMAMGGYGARTGVAQGVLDPVQARVLAISDGRRTIALVTLDLVSGLD